MLDYVDDPNKQRVDNKNYKYDKVNFQYDAQTDTYICSEGKRLVLKSEKEDKNTYDMNVKTASYYPYTIIQT